MATPVSISPERKKALEEALAPIEAMHAEREARRNRCIEKLIASGRFAVVDLDARTVTHFSATGEPS